MTHVCNSRGAAAASSQAVFRAAAAASPQSAFRAAAAGASSDQGASRLLNRPVSLTEAGQKIN